MPLFVGFRSRGQATRSFDSLPPRFPPLFSYRLIGQLRHVSRLPNAPNIFLRSAHRLPGDPASIIQMELVSRLRESNFNTHLRYPVVQFSNFSPSLPLAIFNRFSFLFFYFASIATRRLKFVEEIVLFIIITFLLSFFFLEI